MLPALRDGDLALVSARPVYWPGDIIVFPDGVGALKVHRVLGPMRARAQWLYLTRGDACAVADSPVPYGRVIGKVVNAPTLGPIRRAYVRAKAIVDFATAIAHYVREHRCPTPTST